MLINTSLTPITLTLMGWAGCSVMMLAAWIIAMRKKFLSLVDVAWALGIGLCAILYHLVFTSSAGIRSALSISAALLWSLRLGGYLSLRLFTHYPNEDSRYIKLKAAWKENLALKSFLFFQFQAITQALFAYPFAVTALDNSPYPHWLEILGVSIALIGIAGESIADRQLKTFKQAPQNQGMVCNAGLWKYSRHPNYFFEWIIWCGFGTMALSGPFGALAALCPLTMLLLLLFVTGVAPSEEQALKSRGTAYKQYQKVTSKFIPWFPKKNTVSL